MALRADGVGDLTSTLPLNLGQDGTGTYSHNLDADIDDLAIWKRALAPDEIGLIYAQGNGTNVGSLR